MKIGRIVGRSFSGAWVEGFGGYFWDFWVMVRIMRNEAERGVWYIGESLMLS